MKLDALCTKCLKFQVVDPGSGFLHVCNPDSEAETERRAKRLLAYFGYRISYGAVWYVVNDDPDNFQERRIAGWEGSYTDGLVALIEHGLPKTDILSCPICGTAPVEDLGFNCYECTREQAIWDRVDAL